MAGSFEDAGGTDLEKNQEFKESGRKNSMQQEMWED
jgi:hypothetical protein